MVFIAKLRSSVVLEKNTVHSCLFSASARSDNPGGSHRLWKVNEHQGIDFYINKRDLIHVVSNCQNRCHALKQPFT